MTISLRPVTRENWLACVRLQVHPEQHDLVAPNVYSIAQSKFYPDAEMRGIYADETLVGFVMWGEAEEHPGETWIWRLMVDARYQGRGHAHIAMQMLMDRWRAEGVKAVALSYAPRNAQAAQLYERLGFRPTGAVEHGEVVVRKVLNEKPDAAHEDADGNRT
jgi:diamine N-acetyltransferase